MFFSASNTKFCHTGFFCIVSALNRYFCFSLKQSMKCLGNIKTLNRFSSIIRESAHKALATVSKDING